MGRAEVLGVTDCSAILTWPPEEKTSVIVAQTEAGSYRAAKGSSKVDVTNLKIGSQAIAVACVLEDGSQAWREVVNVICLDSSACDLRVTSLDSSSVTVVWDQVPHATSYYIETRKRDEKDSEWQVQVKPTECTATISQLTVGTNYLLRVRAVCKTCEEYSGVAIAFTPTAPVSNLTANRVGSSVVELGWSPVRGVKAEYIVQWRPCSSGPLIDWSELPRAKTPTTTHVVFGLQPLTEYEFRVLAGVQECVVIANAATTPNCQVVAVGKDWISLSWSSLGRSSIAMRRSFPNQGPWESCGQFTSENCKINNIPANTPLQLRISPPNEKVHHFVSLTLEHSATQPAIFECVGATERVKTKAALSLAFLGETSVRIVWDRVSGAGCYRVTKVAGGSSVQNIVEDTAFESRQLTTLQRHRFDVESAKTKKGPWDQIGSIEVVPCASPSNLTVTNSQPHSVTLSWSALQLKTSTPRTLATTQTSITPSDVTYMVERRVANNAQNTFDYPVVGQHMLGAVVADLQPSVTYEFRVRCKVGSEFETRGSVLEFTTPATEKEEDNSSKLQNSSLTVKWDGRSLPCTLVTRGGRGETAGQSVHRNCDKFEMDALESGKHYELVLDTHSLVGVTTEGGFQQRAMNMFHEGDSDTSQTSQGFSRKPRRVAARNTNTDDSASEVDQSKFRNPTTTKRGGAVARRSGSETKNPRQVRTTNVQHVVPERPPKQFSELSDDMRKFNTNNPWKKDINQLFNDLADGSQTLTADKMQKLVESFGVRVQLNANTDRFTREDAFDMAMQIAASRGK